jgi:hypothetical protein
MGLLTHSTRSCCADWYTTKHLGPQSHDIKGVEPRSQRTKVTQGLDRGEGSSHDSIASCRPQGTAHCMMMTQTGTQVAVSLRGHGHGGLGLIARCRPTGVGARARRQSAVGQGTVGVTPGRVAGGRHHHGGSGPVAVSHGAAGRHQGGASLSSG